MARKTNKEQVLTLAAQLGVEVEYGQMGSEGFEVALYGYAAHMAFDPMGEGHTSITNQAGTGARTESRIWGMALEDLREFVPCADNCHCRVTEPEPVPEPEPCPVCLPHRGWAHGNEARRKHHDICRSCLGSGVVQADVIVTEPEPEPEPEPVTRCYMIVNSDTEEMYIGSVIGNCEPVEAMRTMIGIVNNVSRETVTLEETSDGWKWWIRSTLDRGTARFRDPAPNPYRPAPVTLTHSNHS